MRKLAAGLAITLALTVLPAVLPDAAQAKGPELRAVLVGVNHFQGRTKPNVGAVGDVMDVREALTRHGWPAGSIRVLTDGAATAASVRAGLEWLAGNKDPDSHSVFFYSGHVKQMGGDLDRDGEALDEYLWPHDNQFISDGEMSAYLRSIGGYAWIGLAGCEASGFDEGVSNDKRLFTASSGEPEKSYEYPPWSNSVWGGLFVDEGILQGKADANHDGTVTLREASAYAERVAPEMTARQKTGPQHPYFSGGAGLERTLHPAGFKNAPGPGGGNTPGPSEEKQQGAKPFCIGTICLPDLSALLPR